MLFQFEKLKNLEYITGDLESPIADVKMDLHEIPFEDKTFDIVFCNHVLEHVENDRRCMQEIYRVLKPKGWAIMQVPLNMGKEKTDEDPSVTDPEERKRRFGQYDHVRAYGRDYVVRLKKAGFDVEEVNLTTELSEEQKKRYALPENEPLFICMKLK